MKKLVVVAASILCCLPMHAQEAENSGAAAEFEIVPRFDLNPWFYDGAKNEMTLGNTALYTLFEGNISPNFSYSVCNHWLSAHPKYLYDNTLRSDDNSWVDWLNLTYSVKNFSITIGKDMVTTGGFEYDDYDFDVHPQMESAFWNNFACYQWGAKAGYALAEGSHEFTFQFSTSPYGERPFSSELYNYSLGWKGDFGKVRTIWSGTMVEKGPGEFEYLLSLGQQADLGDFTLGVDYLNRVGDEQEILTKGTTLLASAVYAPSDHYDITLKGGFESRLHGQNSGFIGASAHWYLLKERNLRLHTAMAYNSFDKSFALTLGAIWHLRFTVLK